MPCRTDLDGEVRAISASHVGAPTMTAPCSLVMHLLAEAGQRVEAEIGFQPDTTPLAPVTP